MLQVHAASCPYTATCTLAFFHLLVKTEKLDLAMLSFLRSEILMGSKYGLHLCAHSLITTCRWPLNATEVTAAG